MFGNLFGKIIKRNQHRLADPSYMDEFCLNCNADLRKQPGFSPELDYWVCRSCNQLLTNPHSELFEHSDIVWICDECETVLNAQMGFSDDVPVWKCQKCGHDNEIASGKIFESEADYLEDKFNPTRGLSDEEILRLSCYREVGVHKDRNNVILVEDPETGKLYVKKIMSVFDYNVIKTLYENPVKGMPKIVELFKGERFVILIEEYVDGDRLDDYISSNEVSEAEAKDIILQLCDIVARLHSFTPSIIHRDIKPDNIMLDKNGRIILLDVDGAKAEKMHEQEDTVLFGTKNYAAPEQYGFQTSSVRTDVYAIGILFNVLLTGHFPKEEVSKNYSNIIKRCTKMDPEDRYQSIEELIADIQKG